MQQRRQEKRSKSTRGNCTIRPEMTAIASGGYIAEACLNAHASGRTVTIAAMVVIATGCRRLPPLRCRAETACRRRARVLQLRQIEDGNLREDADDHSGSPARPSRRRLSASRWPRCKKSASNSRRAHIIAKRELTVRAGGPAEDRERACRGVEQHLVTFGSNLPTSQKRPLSKHYHRDPRQTPHLKN